MTKARTFDDIEAAARHEDWGFVDAQLEPFLTSERFEWALQEIKKSQNRNVRDLAATILDRTTFDINLGEQTSLIEQMADKMEYHIVRYRIAIALYQRNIRTPAVKEIMLQASDDPELGELAKHHLKGTPETAG